MTSPTIRLDIHAHLVPLQPENYPGDSQGAHWNAQGHLVVEGVELTNAQVYEPRALLAWMDQNAVEVAWISVPPTLYRPTLDAESARRWCLRLNTGLNAVVAQHPKRLQALHHLPIQHPDVAAWIVTQSAQTGQRRFAMAAGDPVGLRTLSSPEFLPLWETLHAAGAFLFLHPGRTCDPRLRQLSLMNLLGGPSETALAGAHLAMSGIPQRYPDITFCLAHGGGTLAAVAGRLQRGQDTGRDGASPAGPTVRQALRRFCVDCITHDAASLELAAETFGEHHVVFGSDWPFAMGLQKPQQQLAGVAPALLAKIIGHNAAALREKYDPEQANS
jgi:aminocarboxymuconate-semialdehyde decarboxylase